MEDFKSITLNILSGLICAAIVYFYDHKDEGEKEYSKTYIIKVNMQFYVSLLITILTHICPETENTLFNTFIGVLFFFSCTFAVFAFMCLMSVINYLNNLVADKETDEES